MSIPHKIKNVLIILVFISLIIIIQHLSKIDWRDKTKCELNVSEDGCICDEWKEEPCLSELNYYIPLDYPDKLELKIEIDKAELCYDFENDPENISAQVNRTIREHPSNWSFYIKPTKHDPVINIIKTNTSSVYMMKVMTTKMNAECLSSHKITLDDVDCDKLKQAILEDTSFCEGKGFITGKKPIFCRSGWIQREKITKYYLRREDC